MRISKLINIIDVDPCEDFFEDYPPMTAKTSHKESTDIQHTNFSSDIKSSSPKTVRNISYFGNEKTSEYPLEIVTFSEITPQSGNWQSTANPRHVKGTTSRITWSAIMHEVLCELHKKHTTNPETRGRKWQFITRDMNNIFQEITFTAAKCTNAYRNLHRKTKKQLNSSNDQVHFY